MLTSVPPDERPIVGSTASTMASALYSKPASSKGNSASASAKLELRRLKLVSPEAASGDTQLPASTLLTISLEPTVLPNMHSRPETLPRCRPCTLTIVPPDVGPELGMMVLIGHLWVDTRTSHHAGQSGRVCCPPQLLCCPAAVQASHMSPCSMSSMSRETHSTPPLGTQDAQSSQIPARSPSPRCRLPPVRSSAPLAPPLHRAHTGTLAHRLTGRRHRCLSPPAPHRPPLQQVPCSSAGSSSSPQPSQACCHFVPKMHAVLPAA